MNKRNILAVTAFAALMMFQPVWAAETDHSQHAAPAAPAAAAATDHSQHAAPAAPAAAAAPADHAQHHPAAPAEGEAASAGGSHAEKMEKKMAKVEIVVNQLTKKMDGLKKIIAQAKEATGEERKQLLARHGEGLKEILQGVRNLTQKSMGKEKMAGMMGEGKEGMKEKGGMMGGGKGGMMGGMDMQEHHELMEKRLALLFDMMEQMMEHGQVAGAGK